MIFKRLEDILQVTSFWTTKVEKIAWDQKHGDEVWRIGA